MISDSFTSCTWQALLGAVTNDEAPAMREIYDLRYHKATSSVAGIALFDSPVNIAELPCKRTPLYE